MIRRHRGFTIVELLIVIVVIAVLAAITIVAFNGVATRAENAKTISAASTMNKALRVYAETNSMYNTDTYSCVGVAPCSMVSGSTTCFGYGSVGGVGPSFVSDMTTVMSSVPSPSSQRMTCGSGSSYAGMFVYSYNSRKSAIIAYFLKGNGTDCGVSGAQRAVDGDVVRCAITLPNL